MKKFVVALCLVTLAVPMFIASATPMSVAHYEVQDEVVSAFNILPVKLVGK